MATVAGAIEAPSPVNEPSYNRKSRAVGDPRTNSLVVSAARETMMQIAEMVGRLDSTDAKKQRVYVHSLEHADADAVASVLRGMLGDQSMSGSRSQTEVKPAYGTNHDRRCDGFEPAV
jgi:type II secretory pathway component GspD/PulD (secretin)